MTTQTTGLAFPPMWRAEVFCAASERSLCMATLRGLPHFGGYAEGISLGLRGERC